MADVAIILKRLRDAGATDAELEVISERFGASDVIFQNAWAESFTSETRGSLIEWLNAQRADGSLSPVTTSTTAPLAPGTDNEVGAETIDDTTNTDDAPAIVTE